MGIRLGPDAERAAQVLVVDTDELVEQRAPWDAARKARERYPEASV